MSIITRLVDHLRSRKGDIVRDVEVVGENWSPTYGSSPCTVTISVIEWEALLNAMDEFGRGLRTDEGLS